MINVREFADPKLALTIVRGLRARYLDTADLVKYRENGRKRERGTEGGGKRKKGREEWNGEEVKRGGGG